MRGKVEEFPEDEFDEDLDGLGLDDEFDDEF
jgi:hypothetical protein